MPTVGKKKYPYTKAGKAAAAAARKTKAGARKLGKAASKVAKKAKSKTGKSIAKEALIGGMTGAGAGGLLKKGRKKKAKRSAHVGGAVGEGVLGGRKKAVTKEAKTKRKGIGSVLPKSLKRTPAQIARIKAGGRNAKKKRKAGKGQQK